MAGERKRLDQATEGMVALVGILASVLFLAVTIGLLFIGKEIGLNDFRDVGSHGMLLLAAAAIAYCFVGWICCLHIIRAAVGYRGDGGFWP